MSSNLNLSGTITFTFIQDNTTNPRFFGTFSGSGFTNLAFDLTTTTLPNLHPSASCAVATTTCLTSLVAAGGGATETVGVSSGEIEGIPSPVSGAGLPGLMAACVGLLFLGQRRRHQQLVA
jgi:hypothetical protein